MLRRTAVLSGIGILGVFALFLWAAPFVFSDSASTAVNVIVAQCSDGIDNDGDTLIDYPADPDCTSAVDDDESTPAPVFQCSDGIDNDGDTLIDYPADAGCSSATDNNEVNEVIVIGTGYSIPPVTGTSTPGATSSLPFSTSTESTTTVYLPTLPQDENATAALRLTDFNHDLKTNIADLSILLYQMQHLSQAVTRYDLNRDGTLDLVDISILLYYWA